MKFDSVLLVGYGGPSRPGEVRAFLEYVLRGRPVAPGRIEEVEEHYRAVGGASPFVERSRRQAAALQRVLNLPVTLGTRNWHPFLGEAVAHLAREGRRRTAAVVMAPHRCRSSWEQYREEVAAACREVGEEAPAISFTASFHDHPGFLDAQADRVRQALTGLDRPFLLFTAHSVPLEMARQSPYEEQFRATCEGVARRVGDLPWRMAYQSRSGDPAVPWLEPDVNRALEDLARQGIGEVLLVPAGFVCDHVEVLYDLDIAARETARRLGLKAARAGTVEDHPRFIQGLAELVGEAP